MKNENYTEETLLNRRYPSIVKTRKEWICDRCSKLIGKGAPLEHSYTPDMGGAIELCVSCAEILDVQKELGVEV